MEILDTRTGQYRKTGEGAIMRSPVETWAAFQTAKKALHVPGGGLVLDLYVDDELKDTITLNSYGFKRLTGSLPKSPQEYEKYDTVWWHDNTAGEDVGR